MCDDEVRGLETIVDDCKSSSDRVLFVSRGKCVRVCERAVNVVLAAASTLTDAVTDFPSSEITLSTSLSYQLAAALCDIVLGM